MPDRHSKRANGNGAGARSVLRHRSAEEWARIVQESFTSGSRVTEVARRHGVSRSQLSRWRGRARQGELTLPSVEPAFAAVAMQEILERGFVTIEGRGVTLRLEAELDAARIAAIVVALAGCG